MIELQEIMTRQPQSPEYALDDLKTDAVTAKVWHESFKTWSTEYDAKLKELEKALNDGTD